MKASSNYLDLVDGLLADPLCAARAAADGGHPVVGYVGDEIPVALILAAGAVPVELRGDPRAPTPHADQILESAFAPAARAIAEHWLTGVFDPLDSVIFSRADDSAQRLYYYLCELQRRGRCGGPRPLLYDIAKIARLASIAHSRDSTRRLADELAARPWNLAAAVSRVARRDSLLDHIGQRQRADDPLVGSLAWRIRHASALDWSDAFDEATASWLATAPASMRPRRILLAGNSLPDDSLHQVIEAAGACVVRELTGPIVSPLQGVASLDALADLFHARRTPVLAMREDAGWIADCARGIAADGVVFWLIEEDEALPWEIARQMRTLRDQRIPALLLSRQHWIADERARRSTTEFVSGLEVRR